MSNSMISDKEQARLDRWRIAAGMPDGGTWDFSLSTNNFFYSVPEGRGWLSLDVPRGEPSDTVVPRNVGV